MRTRNALERLAAAGGPLLAEAESLVDAEEEERILARIFAAPRSGAVGVRAHSPRLRRAAALAAVAGVATTVALVAASETRHGTTPHHRLGLTGATIQLAGYRFKSPAGFTRTESACEAGSKGPGPAPVMDGFSAAASADGGCLEAAVLVAGPYAKIPADAQPSAVGNYKGYLVSSDSTAESALYVELPDAVGNGRVAYLLLLAKGLTSQQLIAVAQSGLPTLPLKPTTTTGTETG